MMASGLQVTVTCNHIDFSVHLPLMMLGFPKLLKHVLVTSTWFTPIGPCPFFWPKPLQTRLWLILENLLVSETYALLISTQLIPIGPHWFFSFEPLQTQFRLILENIPVSEKYVLLNIACWWVSANGLASSIP